MSFWAPRPRIAVEKHAADDFHNDSFRPAKSCGINHDDLAIGACGATTWERTCLKLPSLAVTIAGNQQPFAEALDNSGYLKLLGDADTVSAKQIRSELIKHISRQGQHFGNVGEDLTDGLGAYRLAVAMLGPKTPTSSCWGRRNVLYDGQMASGSKQFPREQIAPSDHHHWFIKALADSERLLLIALAK